MTQHHMNHMDHMIMDPRDRQRLDAAIDAALTQLDLKDLTKGAVSEGRALYEITTGPDTQAKRSLLKVLSEFEPLYPKIPLRITH